MHAGAHAMPASVSSGPQELDTSRYFDIDKVEGMIFDVDGTLLDSDPYHHQAFAELLPETGFNDGKPIAREFYDNVISGNETSAKVADFFPDWTQAQVDEFSERKERRFRELAEGNLEPTPGLLSFLKAVTDRGIKVTCVTNAVPANVKAMFAALGVGDYFPEPVFGFKLDNAKPAPDPYKNGLEKLGLQGSKVVAFEDSPSGITSASRAGCIVIGLATTHGEEDLKKEGADHVVKDYSDFFE